MNVIGQIGNFIVDNQKVIGISLIVLLALIVLIVVIKGIITSYKKRDLLAKISETVTEINSTVSDISKKKTDVIYIDNRVPGQIQDKQVVSDNVEESVDKCEGPNDTSEMEEPEKSTEIPKKYFSRDCAVDKNGRTYTMEELKKQIIE